MPATDEYVRSPKQMHRIFALSTVLMFIAFLWMMVADHADEWRDYQTVFNDINVARLEQDQAQFDSQDFQAQSAALKAEMEAAEKAVESNKSAIDELQSRIKQAELASNLAEREVKNRRAFRDEARANYDLGVTNHAAESKLASLMARFEELQSVTDEFELDTERKKAVLDDLKSQLAEATKSRDAAARRLSDAEKELNQKLAAKDRIDPSGYIDKFKREIMGWPIFDGFNSHYQIQMDWIPGLDQKLGMAKSARFDRCGTCHLGISDVAAGNVPSYPHADHPGGDYKEWVASNKYPHPYSTHPNPDLFVTATSPHPREKFGCTICHEGQGSGTSFQNASHGPNDPIQEHKWAKQFGYFDNHFWEYPMLPARFEEAHCIKCHHNVTELGIHPKFGASAPKVFSGYEIVRTYGCFGCHEIHGYAGANPIGPDLRLEPQTDAQAKAIAEDRNQIAGKLRKVGPSLRHLASKTSRGWIEDWMKDPQNFRPTTRMPRFFDLTNQQDLQAQRYQPVEIAALTQFLLKTSEAFETQGPAEGYQPDAERGKTFFSQKGCMACHSNSAFDDLNPDFGPNLDKIHAKLAAGETGFNWLYTWIKEPTHYHKRTKMPDLYLDPYKEGEATIDPAADIAAWLLEKGPQEWPEIDVDEKALDELVALFLEKKVLKSDQFKEFMETRDLSLGGTLSQDSLKGDEVELWTDPGTTVDDAQWMQMRLNFVGRRTVSRYGCYGCHDIPGFEDARPIGVALQDWGRKDRSQLAPEHIHEFLHSHAVEYLVVPLAESENAGEILAEIDGPIAFREWVQGRDESLPAAITETLNHGDYGKTIGDFAEHHHLKPGEWTKEPYEFNGQKFLILVESSHSFEEEVKEYLHQAETDSFASEADREHGLSVAYLYQNLLHHGRAGFAWQKLRQPRSYDFEKVSTKGYDERLRMPKFPFSHQQIEQVTTFLLGLVAEPPSEEYVYRPAG
ncbi:MAG TPA: c-type cytochrome, partial [Planctomycetaceae bacterium]|nr:c-type cytochrome [Planctomycetaceae bacterium]